MDNAVQNEVVLFFVCLKSGIEQIREREPLRPDILVERIILTIYDIFAYEDYRNRSTPLSLETKHPENRNRATPFYFTQSNISLVYVQLFI